MAGSVTGPILKQTKTGLSNLLQKAKGSPSLTEGHLCRYSCVYNPIFTLYLPTYQLTGVAIWKSSGIMIQDGQYAFSLSLTEVGLFHGECVDCVLSLHYTTWMGCHHCPCFFFLSFNLSIVLVIFNFAIMFHKINKPDTEGYPGFCESEICYVSGFTPKSISGDQTPIH